MIKLKYFWVSVVACLLGVQAGAQTTRLTLEACYELSRQNFPLIKKQDLITKSNMYSIANANRRNLPQLSINGVASYQSETISFPDALGGPMGMVLPALSKDQYKIQGEITQQLYDGGYSRNQKSAIRTSMDVQQQNIEVMLYALKERVTQVYFSVLLMDAQLGQNAIRKANLQNAEDKAAAAFQNGTTLRSNVDELLAEIASAEMTNIELRANRKAYLNMLSLFIGKNITDNTQLEMPAQQSNIPEIKRPELTLYDLQKKTFDVQERQLRSDYLPKLNAFVQGAYGRPTLNIIENKFGPWWIGGLRLSWNLGSLYTLKNNRTIIDINRQTVEVDREIFTFNTNLTLTQQSSDALKFSSLINQDDEIISLRESVTKSAQMQLDNGVITVHDYISKVNAEDNARQMRILHTLQLLQAQYNYKNTSGN